MPYRDPAAGKILNAAWWVRHYCRPDRRSKLHRQAALRRLARAAIAALEAPDPEAALYAIAAGLYDRTDPRFTP
jgi:hypothetical protein